MNGSYKGTTPINITLSNGTQAITISASGYENYTTNVTIFANTTSTLNVQLNKTFHIENESYQNITGNIYIETAPLGAFVFINGSYKGVTPINITNVTGGLNVTISYEGYANFSGYINVTPANTTTIFVQLNKS